MEKADNKVACIFCGHCHGPYFTDASKPSVKENKQADSYLLDVLRGHVFQLAIFEQLKPVVLAYRRAGCVHRDEAKAVTEKLEGMGPAYRLDYYAAHFNCLANSAADSAYQTHSTTYISIRQDFEKKGAACLYIAV